VTWKTSYARLAICLPI